MIFTFLCCGFGFCLQVNAYDINTDGRIILSWSVIKNHIVWRGESHRRSHGGYNYRCIKNGEDVENISFRSPIVSNL